MPIKISHLTAGIIAILVGYSSAAALILEAVNAMGGSSDLQSSWLTAIALSAGASTLFLSWYYRAPILTAWSTPGIALLISALAGVTPAEAVGVFIFSSFLLFISGFGRWVERGVNWIPAPIAAALLAGILLQFVTRIIPALEQSPVPIAVMLVLFFMGRTLIPRFVFPLVFAAALVLPIVLGDFNYQALTMQAPVWVWNTPEFKIDLLIGIGIPLYIVTMVSQNIPGLFMLKSQGYPTPTGPILRTTGIAGLIMAPFGAFAVNLAAITAAICQSPDADPNAKTRYKASMVAGVTYLLFALLGASIVSLFTAIPASIVTALAGLALLGVLTNTLGQAFSAIETREAATVTFVITVSGFSLWGLNSAFWGLIVGVALHFFVTKLKRASST